MILSYHKEYWDKWGDWLFIMLKDYILPLFLICLLLAGITTLYQYIKYGNRAFNVFKRKDISMNRDQLLFLSLDRIKGYKKIIKLPYLTSNYILIDKSGISLFELFLEKGIITGNEIDNELVLKQNKKDYKKTYNPFIPINNDEETLKNILPNININKYIVTLDECLINVDSNVKVIKYNRMLYNLKENQIMYDNKQIDDIAKELNRKKCQQV